MLRNTNVFRHEWRSVTISAVIQPCIYLAILTIGIGSLVSRIGRVSYVDFAGTGMVAGALIYSAMVPAVVRTYSGWRINRTYDALLAAPVTISELVTAEIVWLALQSMFYGVLPLVAATVVFGMEPHAGIAFVPFIAGLSALGVASLGIVIGTMAKSADHFGDGISAVVSPLFLLAGTIVPITRMPTAIRALAQCDPLYHCVQLVRDASFGVLHAHDLLHVGFLLVFALCMWRIATRRLEKVLLR